jgi:hypothetical protein
MTNLSDIRQTLPVRSPAAQVWPMRRRPPCKHGVVNIPDWFAARIPPGWKARALDVAVDQDEIVVVVGAGDDDLDARRIRFWRETTRDERVAIALVAEKTFGRKVSWGLKGGESVVFFSTASVPVMTRLRMPERQVLDTLIEGGLARTRSEALSWCVRLVGENETEWMIELRESLQAVREVRERGPASRRNRADTNGDPGPDEQPAAAPKPARPRRSTK